MSKISAIIERASDGGFSIYAPSVNGAYALGLTEAEAKQEFVQILHEQAEYYKERTGALPEWYDNGDFEVEYTYALSGFFEAYPFINATKFAQAVGINPSLMRKYKAGISGISPKQKALIQAKFENIVADLRAVQF